MHLHRERRLNGSVTGSRTFGDSFRRQSARGTKFVQIVIEFSTSSHDQLLPVNPNPVYCPKRLSSFRASPACVTFANGKSVVGFVLSRILRHAQFGRAENDAPLPVVWVCVCTDIIEFIIFGPFSW